MRAIAHEVLDPRDVPQSVETDLLENGSADVRPRVLHYPVGLQGLPILRGAAYLAALNGEPWRPQV